LSVRALFPRFVESEQADGSLLKAFRRARPARDSADGAFKSLPGGLGELISALGAALPPASIRLRAAVARVSAAAGGAQPYRVEMADGGWIDASSVVVAAPAYAAATILGRLAPDIARLCGDIPYTSVATVALAFEADAIARPLTGSGFVVPRVERSSILAATWLSSKWPNRAPEGRALVRAFVGGARDPDALDRTDDELVRGSIAALTPLAGIRRAPLFTRVYRWPRANAQHEVGHLDRIAALDRALARRPGLFITGSGFRGVGIPDCIADARATAQAAADSLSAQHAD
jgi:oxygen-dependent protoporphyrinogen oxidase